MWTAFDLVAHRLLDWSGDLPETVSAGLNALSLTINAPVLEVFSLHFFSHSENRRLRPLCYYSFVEESASSSTLRFEKVLHVYQYRSSILEAFTPCAQSVTVDEEVHEENVTVKEEADLER